MVERGFIPAFPQPVLNELEKITLPAEPFKISAVRDMRDRFFVSIDNDDSLDLDQLTFAEKPVNGKNKIYIAIADVDGLVKINSAIDHQAAHNTTSVYTPAKIFPMLPPKLSTDLTSLNENSDRSAIVVEVDVDQTGTYNPVDIYPAWVKNKAKLAYNGVAARLEQNTPLPEKYEKQAALIEQLTLQDEIAQRIKKYRFIQGALTFETIELQPIIVNGVPVKLEEKKANRADELIENFMIVANVAVTRYLSGKGMPTIRRIVKTPKRWDRIVELAAELGEKLPDEPDGKALQEFLIKQKKDAPEKFADLSLAIIKLVGRGEYVVGIPGKKTEGHFDLAIRNYSHTTAPNRRFPDLIMQRLLKCCFLNQKPPYSEIELNAIASHCTEKEDDATKVERRMIKSAAAMLLIDQIGRAFPAIVTGAGEKGTWVRLMTPPIEGKVTENFLGLDVGQRVMVKLTYVDIIKGFIDFERI